MRHKIELFIEWRPYPETHPVSSDNVYLIKTRYGIEVALWRTWSINGEIRSAFFTVATNEVMNLRGMYWSEIDLVEVPR